MNKTTEYTMMVLALIFFVGCTAPQAETVTEETPKADLTADISAIKAVHEIETTGINGNDTESYLAVLDDNVVIFPEQAPAVRGKEAVREWHREMTGMDFELTGTSGEIIVSGEYAFESYTWTFSGILPGTEEPLEDSGAGVHVYKKQADGSWKIFWDIWNSDHSAIQLSEDNEAMEMYDEDEEM